jgi:signal transduction histidine kinase/ligand-binding sensor domain-containing protein/ActR/RegA family two-component response regulator
VKRFLKAWVLVTLASLVGRAMWAQQLEVKPTIARLLDPGEDWRWRTYPFEEAAEAVKVTIFFEDSEGQEWAGSSRGLLRFSGYRWEWEPLPVPTTGRNTIGAIFERVPGELLVQVDGQLVRRVAGHWETVHDGLAPGDDILRSAPVGGNKAFVFTSGGDYVYDGVRFARHPERLPTGGGSQVLLSAGQQQDLWFGGPPGLLHSRGGKWEHALPSQSPISIESLVFGVHFGLMALRGPLALRGLWEWNSGGWTRVNGSEQDVVVSAAISNANEAVVASESGQAAVCVAGRWQTIRQGLGALMLRRPSAIGFQRNGTLWVASESGISAYRTGVNTWLRAQFPAPDLRNTIHEVLVRKNGEIWTGGIEGVTVRRAGQEPELIRRAAGIDIRNVTGLAEDDAGRVWVSSGSEFGGAVQWEHGKWQRVRAGDGLTDEPINRIVSLRLPKGGGSELWFLVTLPAYQGRAELAGAFQFRNGRFERWSTRQGLPNNAVHAVTIDREGARWFGSRDGVTRLKEGEPVRHWQSGKVVAGARLQEILADPAGRIWFVHRNFGGVAMLDPSEGWDRVHYFTVKEGLPSDEAWGLTLDSAERLWVSTRNGVAVWAGGPWVKFRTGIGNELFNAWPMRESNGKMVVGTVGQGLHFLDLQWNPDRLPRIDFRRPAIVDGRVIFEWRTRTRLEDQRDNEVLTRSRIDGGEWSGWSTQRRQVFAATSYGQHVLEVQSAGFWGDVNPQIARIEVEVPSPFYRQPLFLAVTGLLLSGVVVLGVVNWRRRADYTRQLMRAKQEAEEGAKAKSIFLAMMSHEIRTPMNGVLGMSSLLIETPLAEEQRQCVATIQHSAESLLRVIDDALDYSKIEAGVLEIRQEPFSIEELADSVAVLMTPRAIEKQIDLAVAIEGDLPALVTGDAARLHQILLNLTSNALKFTDQGWVEIRISGHATNGQNCLIRLAVADTGIGIAPDKLDLLFREFSQVDSSMTRRHGGTGLGLVISRRLAERMNGRTGVTSTVGQGSVFWCEIPFPIEQPATPHESITTLVVAAGDRPGTAAVGRHVKGFAGFQAQQEPVDQIVVDGWLPSADWQAILEWRTEHPELANTRWVALLPGPEELGPAELGPDWRRLQRPLSRRRLNLGRGAPAPPPLDSASLAGMKILVAEDNRTNQQVVRKLLERMGCLVTIVEDGAAALVTAAAEDFDIILMDCQMPVMDGLEATRQLRAGAGRNARTAIIALTANGFETDRQSCLAAGMSDFLPKPIDKKALRDALERSGAKPALS